MSYNIFNSCMVFSKDVSRCVFVPPSTAVGALEAVGTGQEQALKAGGWKQEGPFALSIACASLP